MRAILSDKTKCTSPLRALKVKCSFQGSSYIKFYNITSLVRNYIPVPRTITSKSSGRSSAILGSLRAKYNKTADWFERFAQSNLILEKYNFKSLTFFWASGLVPRTLRYSRWRITNERKVTKKLHCKLASVIENGEARNIWPWWCYSYKSSFCFSKVFMGERNPKVGIFKVNFYESCMSLYTASWSALPKPDSKISRSKAP